HPQQLLTPEEVASLLGVSRLFAVRQSRAGKIPAIKLGKAYRYRANTIDSCTLPHGPLVDTAPANCIEAPASSQSGRRRRACALASVRRPNCTYGFPYAAFTKTQRRQDAREGIK